MPPTCPNCHFEFAPDAPPTARCPSCQASLGPHLALAASEGAAVDETFTARERRRWLVCFWVLLVAGPCLAFACEFLDLAQAAGRFGFWQALPFQPANPALVLLAGSIGASFLLIRAAAPDRLGCGSIAGILTLGLGLLFLQWLLLLLLREALH